MRLRPFGDSAGVVTGDLADPVTVACQSPVGVAPSGLMLPHDLAVAVPWSHPQAAVISSSLQADPLLEAVRFLAWRGYGTATDPF